MKNTSFHAEVCLRQRVISRDTARLLTKHGEECPATDGAYGITLSKRQVGIVISELKKKSTGWKKQLMLC